MLLMFINVSLVVYRVEGEIQETLRGCGVENSTMAKNICCDIADRIHLAKDVVSSVLLFWAL